MGLYKALTEGCNEALLAQKAMECFSITYTIDQFFPSQELLQSTYSCPICHVVPNRGFLSLILHRILRISGNVSQQIRKSPGVSPKDRRLDNRADIALVSQREYSFAAACTHEAARRLFQGLMEQCQLELYDPKYFKSRGDVVYKAETFKAYAVYLSDSHKNTFEVRYSIWENTLVV